MNVVMLSPGFPLEMAYFTRALAQAGASVIGVGDQPIQALPPEARDHLAHYEHVSLADEDAVLAALHGLARHAQIDQVECLWEPYMVLAARIRGQLGLPGMTVEQTLPFRDKELMKQVLDEAGVRTPRHASTSTVQGVWEAAERIGYPLIVKPIAGAGSADTFRVDSAAELADVLPMIRHVEVVSVEEFIEAEEYTYDTVCGAGDVLFENISWYRPRPLQARSHEWISPMTVALRATDSEQLAGGRAMGREVLQALGFRAGFTHMEWYRKDDGEVVFGEIGARPPGARTVDVMNYATDGDLFQMWAEAVLTGTSAPLTHQYNAASIFKRAVGSGYITRVEGLDELMAAYADNVCVLDLLPIGAHRRDWRATLISDGMIVVRHPDLDALIELGDRFARDLRIYAG
jgi:biotin carboxylase